MYNTSYSLPFCPLLLFLFHAITLQPSNLSYLYSHLPQKHYTFTKISINSFHTSYTIYIYTDAMLSSHLLTHICLPLHSIKSPDSTLFSHHTLFLSLLSPSSNTLHMNNMIFLPLYFYHFILSIYNHLSSTRLRL